ncbi:DUF6542 domain-containing protein [Kitasatospora sp. NPDC097643]|uniref:DUF6542 domain-containing protein n=1 Tax=Kitasatospora sp. NPDC097643 TaxID=3157230 RepID=UPI00332382B3
MAGQRARTPYQEAGPRTDDAAVPAQRSRVAEAAADGVAEAADTTAAVGRPAARAAQRAGTARRRPQARRHGGSPPVLLAALGLPVLGGVADELGGPGVGGLFAIGAVLGTGLAAWLCSRRGRWWVVTAAPVVVLGAASGIEYLWHHDAYQGKQLGTGAIRWVVGAFPVMATAVTAALLVVGVRAALDRRRPPDGRADRPERRSRRG